eukprot:TRINITY_DN20555_c0_g1_i2.p1 TRINITY_DN20555_c0_g1~~TRINITY_DN20555_c0_g1_i2.p1  ORF type:complete len:132 (+),score=30.07 TRINITY_DN20555_c0_g1_i2:229-624(+)
MREFLAPQQAGEGDTHAAQKVIHRKSQQDVYDMLASTVTPGSPADVPEGLSCIHEQPPSIEAQPVQQPVPPKKKEKKKKRPDSSKKKLKQSVLVERLSNTRPAGMPPTAPKLCADSRLLASKFSVLPPLVH